MKENHLKLVRRKCLPIFIAMAISCLALSAQAYTHPCIPQTAEDLAFIKASLNQQPWKQGYALLVADGRSSTNYTMAGPFANVSRAGSYDANLGAWQNDMIAVYNLARMWYFTGDANYAKKAHDILISWANVNTLFNGNEAGLAMGDHAYAFGGGASILRGTWPGWTSADTTTVQNYFRNVLWPNCQANNNITGPGNKGDIEMEAGIALAVPAGIEAARVQQLPAMRIGDVERQAAVGKGFRGGVHPVALHRRRPDQRLPARVQEAGQVHRANGTLGHFISSRNLWPQNNNRRIRGMRSTIPD